MVDLLSRWYISLPASCLTGVMWTAVHFLRGCSREHISSEWRYDRSSLFVALAVPGVPIGLGIWGLLFGSPQLLAKLGYPTPRWLGPLALLPLYAALSVSGYVLCQHIRCLLGPTIAELHNNADVTRLIRHLRYLPQDGSEVARALEAIGDRRAITPLGAALLKFSKGRWRDRGLQFVLASALASFADPGACSVLRRIFLDEANHFTVRAEAGRGLRGVNDPCATDEIVARLEALETAWLLRRVREDEAHHDDR